MDVHCGEIKRGEIYWVDFGKTKGSEQGGKRPALVVQNNIGNKHSPTTIVVAIKEAQSSYSCHFGKRCVEWIKFRFVSNM